MKVAVYIDSCAWNYLHRKQIDLAKELPTRKYSVFMTKEVAIEIAAIPDHSTNADNRPLKEYIRNSMARHSIAISANFGFRSCKPDGTRSETQINGGFGHPFQSAADRHYYDRPEVKEMLNKPLRKKTGLRKNQADASLAVRAARAIILTDESPSNQGPLRLAAEAGESIVYLSTCLEEAGLTLDEYLVRNKLAP